MKWILYDGMWICGILASQMIAVDTYRNQWHQSQYVWDFGLIAAADKGGIADPQVYFSNEERPFDKTRYQDLKAGDIVWLKCLHVPTFCNEVLPHLTTPIVLLISEGDESFPSECGSGFDVELLLRHGKIIHVFAQNCDYNGLSTKVSRVPIGMDLHTIAYKGKNGGWGEKGSPHEQEAVMNDILKTLAPTDQRKKGAFVDFHHADTMRAGLKRYLKCGEDRHTIFNHLLSTGLIDHAPWMRRSDVWKRKGDYAFSISPHGNGLDCHRTWEDLILGCIVIVKTSLLDPLYKDLPVVIVKDWSEITAENLDKWLLRYGDAFTNRHYREKLTHCYWFSQIEAMVRPYKQEK